MFDWETDIDLEGLLDSSITYNRRVESVTVVERRDSPCFSGDEEMERPAEALVKEAET